MRCSSYSLECMEYINSNFVLIFRFHVCSIFVVLVLIVKKKEKRGARRRVTKFRVTGGLD